MTIKDHACRKKGLQNFYYINKNMTDKLKNFNTDTKKFIFEWASKFRGSPLLIVEWDKKRLRQRSIQKFTVITIIRSSRNCFLLPTSGQNKLYSIFRFDDHQIIVNITSALKRAYHQENTDSFGRVYVVVAEKENTFDINEIFDVF
ncbi:unnamed protein product [Rhizophagus irregularis]|uniref:Uncharacterized protein n=2 Tax=Rhizophagus irregularis TaxID=588596 RepID=A0A916E5T3_9GLOM|nr:unnamed protein product [Rhizophagus irregularis]CAB5364652.1 unnamed protein product [Rhizophagus irregularis]